MVAVRGMVVGMMIVIVVRGMVVGMMIVIVVRGIMVIRERSYIGEGVVGEGDGNEPTRSLTHSLSPTAR